jgi:UDP-glucose 4-epimerase
MILILGGTGFIGQNLTASQSFLSEKILLLHREKSKTSHQSASNITNITYMDFLLEFEEYMSEVNLIIYLLPPKIKIKEQIFLDSIINNNYHTNNSKIVYISSSAVYGSTHLSIINEASDLNPISKYGKDKLDEEKKIINSSKNKHFNYTILRPSNIIGEYQKDSFLSKIFSSHKNNQKFEIFGSGEIIRDYLPVGSLIDAIIKVKNDSKNSNNKIFNVGSGLAIKTIDFVNLVEGSCNFKLDVHNIPIPKNHVKSCVLDITKIKSEINWSQNESIIDTIKECFARTMF